MKISYNWLKEYVNIDLPAEEVARILTDTGLEVEGLEKVEAVKGGLKGVVVGEVVECERHPDADRLNVTKVNVGGKELLNIVCGAPNVAVGQKVVVQVIGMPHDFQSFLIREFFTDNCSFIVFGYILVDLLFRD